VCGSRKYSYLPRGGLLEIPRGRETFNTKDFKGKYEAKLEFPEGWGGPNQKTLHGGIMDFFLEQHNTGFTVQIVISISTCTSIAKRYQ